MNIIVIFIITINFGVFIQAHKEKCPNAPVMCSLHCGLRVPKQELTTHIESLCPKRPTTCSHCGLAQTWDNLEVNIYAVV